MPEFMNLYNTLIAISLLSTALYILKLVVFIFVGGDTEVNSDFDTMTETDISFSFVSTQSILAFFMGLGWSGLAALVQFNLSGKLSLAIGILVGLIFMVLTAYLMYAIKKLNKNIKVDLTTLVNTTGKAYINIEPHHEGQIEIDLNQRLSILDATNISDERINAFDPIKVVKVENNKIYVVKGE